MIVVHEPFSLPRGCITGPLHSRRFVRTLYSITPLGSCGGNNNTSPIAINDNGQVNGLAHAFKYMNGAMIDLGTLPNGSLSEAYAISSSG